MRNLLYRITTSLILLPVVVGAFVLDGYYLICLLLLVSALSCFEVINIVGLKNKSAKILALIHWIGLFFPAIFCKDLRFLVFIVPAVLCIQGAILFSESIDSHQYEKLCTIFYWSFYINMSVASIYCLVNTSENLETRTGLSFILLACVATWSNDTFAYFGGRCFGKHSLFKRVSSKKTWEGFFVGGILSIAVVFTCKYLPQLVGFDWLLGLELKDLLWITLPTVVLAPFGDLIESRFKRFYDIKDSSRILPGHGGLLDRIDGLLVVIPWTTLYAFIIRPL
jgi:phosphatidate cytidylyltransferase